MSGYDFFVSLFPTMLSAKFKGLKELLKTLIQKSKKIRIQKNDVENELENTNDNELMDLKNMKKNNDDEINDHISETYLNRIILMIFFISIFNKSKINYLPEEILNLMLIANGQTKEDLNVDLKKIIKNGKHLITFLSRHLKDIFNYIKLDKCLITILFMKHKFGLTLDINSIGLLNLDNELIEMEIQEEKKEQEGEEKQEDMLIQENELQDK